HLRGGQNRRPGGVCVDVRGMGRVAVAVVARIYGDTVAAGRLAAAYAAAQAGRQRRRVGLVRPMFEFKKTTHLQKRRMLIRVVVAGVFIVLCFLGLAGRLWYLQVVRYEGLAARADRNRIAVVPIPPRRGEILDRN